MKLNITKLLLWVLVLGCVNVVSPSYSDEKQGNRVSQAKAGGDDDDDGGRNKNDDDDDDGGRKDRDDDDDDGGGDKVTICHRGNTIRVSRAALRAHLAHGDKLGPCEVTPNRNR